MIFTVDRNLISCVVYDGLNTVLQSAVDRGLFLSNFNAGLTDDINLVSVEFDANIFHIVDKDGLHVYQSCSEHPVLNFFSQNKDNLFNWFLDQENMLNKPSDYHTYDTVSHSWVISEENNELLLAANVRKQRDKLLADTDWTQLNDIPQETKDKWSQYRQSLRDISLQSGFPTNVSFPSKP